MSQKEGDILRGDLLANQKALSDLNAYADSLRSRYVRLCCWIWAPLLP